ncbi:MULTISPECIES: hypothetical protein [unclassified Paenibacillus]|uniref:hypothetical protein n=1 Tax=unclassified Paenibacillus TaxID=185978 RepID=UPI000897E831|nr:MULTISPECIES: hypothetical protein [unclassified Paenibacillus]OMC68612.1 hypothetical protein BK126_12350 [Paenibacillus sp. FSL H7-0326]SDW57290.1 hypothetical protein SAMN05518848_102225 [Paenibacillus sp. PDC88]
MTELTEKLQEWKWLCGKQDTADDRTRCPKCHDQLYFCDCPAQMAQEILEILTANNTELTEIDVVNFSADSQHTVQVRYYGIEKSREVLNCVVEETSKHGEEGIQRSE